MGLPGEELRMSTTIYGVGSHCGVQAGEAIGTIANHQLVLHVNRALTLELR